MKKTLFIIMLALSWLPAQAQTMREAFVSMPDSLQTLLTKNNRMDMLDFLDNKMQAQVTNRFDVQSVMDTLTTDYLKLHTTLQTVVEMKMFSRGEKQFIAMLHTVEGPVKDSVLQFFTADWKEAENLLVLPSFSAYEVKDRKELTQEQVQILEGLADMQLTEMSLSPADNTLRCHLSLEILNKEDREKAVPLVKDVVLELK